MDDRGSGKCSCCDQTLPGVWPPDGPDWELPEGWCLQQKSGKDVLICPCCDDDVVVALGK
jgi:hypothetical protein